MGPKIRCKLGVCPCAQLWLCVCWWIIQCKHQATCCSVQPPSIFYSPTSNTNSPPNSHQMQDIRGLWGASSLTSVCLSVCLLVCLSICLSLYWVDRTETDRCLLTDSIFLSEPILKLKHQHLIPLYPWCIASTDPCQWHKSRLTRHGDDGFL